MAVNFRDPIDSPLTNAAYMSRTTDTSTVGVVGLQNAGSGSEIQNLQQAINKVFADTGVLSETNANATTYTEQNFINNGDSYRLAIDKIDIALQSEVTSLESDIQNLDNKIELGAKKFISYASDSAYETAHPDPLVGGEAYYNTTINRIRFYNIGAELWESIDAALIAIQEIPTGDIDGVNTVFTTAQLPISEDALQVYINGLLIEKSNWSYDYDESEITLTFAPEAGQVINVYYLTQGVPSQPILSKLERVEYIELEAADITAKEVQLAEIPDNYETVLVDVCRSTIGSLIRAVDFEVDDVLDIDDNIVGAKVAWDGFDFDADATAGQVLRVFYFIKEL